MSGSPIKILIAGGGVGALEAVLALRKLAEERVDLTLVCPDDEFRYRPASVAVPFDRGEVYRFPIGDIAAEVGADWRRDVIATVDTAAHRATLGSGEELGYDAAVFAVGARRLPVLKGAIPFRGEEDVPAMQQLVADLRNGRFSSVVFALPRGASWSLPLYELALMTAGTVAADRPHGLELALVTPEERPLAQFGGQVSIAVARLLDDSGIVLHTGTYPVGVYGSSLMLMPPQTIAADRVVCMPAARGIPIPGLPNDQDGFLPTDLYGRVAGAAEVYAVGDITNHPIKQGGVAAQQADVVAQLLARQAGAPLPDPAPHRPALRGLLLTAGRPRYLVAEPAGGRGETAEVSDEPLWWPGGKIAARHLGGYLIRAGHYG